MGELRKKPQVFKYPIFLRVEAFNVFTSRYRMFKEDDYLEDMYLLADDDHAGYIGVWYKSAGRRDADYIRCLRYLLIEVYGKECVFTEPNFRKPITEEDDFVLFKRRNYDF